MTESLRIFAQVAQGIYAALLTALLLIRPFREWFFNFKKKRQEIKDEEEKRLNEMQMREDADREGIKCLLRDSITRFYYAHYTQREIHAYEFENIHMQYNAYKRLGGNSYIDKIYEEVSEWDIIK